MKNFGKFFLAAVAVGVIGPALVLANDDSGSNTQASSPSVDLTEAQRVCIKTALTKRESAVMSAIEAQNSAWKVAFQARGEALGKAWDLTTKKERKAAQEKAWSTFQSAQKSARNTFRSARNAAWSTYKTERKACGKALVSNDVSKEGADSVSL